MGEGRYRDRPDGALESLPTGVVRRLDLFAAPLGGRRDAPPEFTGNSHGLREISMRGAYNGRHLKLIACRGRAVGRLMPTTTATAGWLGPGFETPTTKKRPLVAPPATKPRPLVAHFTERHMSRRLTPDYLPTRRQIIRECAAIRRRWTPAERRRRALGFGRLTAEAMWRPPCINIAACTNRVRKLAADASA